MTSKQTVLLVFSLILLVLVCVAMVLANWLYIDTITIEIPTSTGEPSTDIGASLGAGLGRAFGMVFGWLTTLATLVLGGLSLALLGGLRKSINRSVEGVSSVAKQYPKSNIITKCGLIFSLFSMIETTAFGIIAYFLLQASN